jgi:hypothetical protein
LNPSVDYIDSGELVAVSYILGIPHPTGYPIFTLTAHLFMMLPLSEWIIIRANLFSAFISSLGVFIFAMFLMNTSGDRIMGKLTTQLASISALIFGFTNVFWSQAVRFEVYSLHSMFISLLLLFVFKFKVSGDVRYFLLSFFILGLSMTNHMMTVLTIPALIYLLLRELKFNSNTVRSLLPISTALFILGLTPLIYLPIRASVKPILNWGNPDNIERFIWHITGKQYRTWMFTSFETAMRQLDHFIDMLPENFGYLPLIFIIPGIAEIYKNRRELLYFSIIAFLTCIIYSINYDIHEIDPYFTLSYMMISIWIFHGFVYLSKKFKHTGVTSIIGIISVILTIGFNYSDSDRSKNYLPKKYTLHILKDLDSNAIVFSYQWDYFVSPALYFQHVEKIRPDVVIIDKELLRRSWYFTQLETCYPWLIEKSQREIDMFLHELYKFEHGLPYNPVEIEKRFVNMINSLIDKNIDERPIYLGPEIEPKFGSRYRRVPEGFLFKLYKNKNYVPYDYSPIDVSNRANDKYSKDLMHIISRMLVSRGIYEYRFKKFDRAKFYFDEALKVDPGLVDAIVWKNRLRR